MSYLPQPPAILSPWRRVPILANSPAPSPQTSPSCTAQFRFLSASFVFFNSVPKPIATIRNVVVPLRSFQGPTTIGVATASPFWLNVTSNVTIAGAEVTFTSCTFCPPAGFDLPFMSRECGLQFPGGITLAAGASLSQTADVNMTDVATYGSHLLLSSISPRSVLSNCMEF